MRRFAARSLMVGTAAALALLPASTQTLFASALEEAEPVVILAEPGSTAHYESTLPMPAPDAAGVFTAPEDCATSPTCTLIPLQFKATSKTTDIYIITAVTSWAAVDTPAGISANDIDTYFYEIRPVVQDDGTVADEYVEVGRSASSSQPEKAKLIGEGDTTVYAVISNFAGSIPSFTLDLSYTAAEFDKVEEKLGEVPGGGGFDGFGEDLPDAPPPAESPAPRSATDGSGLHLPVLPKDEPLGSVDVDDTFASVNADTNLDDVLNASKTGSVEGLFRTREIADPEDVSSSMAVFWLLGAPLVLLVAGAALFRRMRPQALRA
jgi:hypothetical protein